MMRWMIPLCAFFGLSTPGLADMTFVNPDNGHTYVLLDGLHSWQEGRSLATAMGGYLVSITSDTENSWIRDTIFVPHAEPRGTQLWIGATDEINEGTWLWESGEAFVYQNWSPGNPNNRIDTGPPDGGGEDYASMWSTPVGSWNDYPSPFIYLPNIPGPSPIWGSVLVEIPAPFSASTFVCLSFLFRRRTRGVESSTATR